MFKNAWSYQKDKTVFIRYADNEDYLKYNW